MQFQSHQLFHTFVVIAALVHLHGVSKMAVIALENGSCPEQLLERCVRRESDGSEIENLETYKTLA